jgi:hypothetical protein
MKRYLLGIFLMVFSMSVMAGKTPIYVDDLTEEQAARLALQAAQMKSAAPPVATVDEVSKWVGIGKDLGSGLNATAKELGITANELAKTPVGTFAMVLIGWSYMGKTLTGIIFGFTWLMFVIPIWVWMYRSRFIVESVEGYEKGKREDGLVKVIKYQTENSDDGIHFLYWLTLIVSIAIGVLAIL